MWTADAAVERAFPAGEKSVKVNVARRIGLAERTLCCSQNRIFNGRPP
jgi:hypothetical protein